MLIPYLGMFSIPSIACDPAEELRRIHIDVQKVPLVVVDPTLKYKGTYSQHVVTVRDAMDCETLRHEWIHFWQDLRDNGPAQSYAEWWAREMQAEMLTKRAIQ